MKNFHIILAFLLFLFSCKTMEKPQEYNLKEIVKNPETALVDVRISEQFKAGTAKNAINIPLAEIDKNIDALKNKKQVVVFCNTGRQAAEAYTKLKKKGVKVYNGKTWKNIRAIQEEQ